MNKSLELIHLLYEVEEGFEVKVLGVLGDALYLEVPTGGRKYGYKPDPEKTDLDAEGLQREFEKRAKYSSGKALAWLKTVTTLSSGSYKGVSKIVRDTPIENKR